MSRLAAHQSPAAPSALTVLLLLLMPAACTVSPTPSDLPTSTLALPTRTRTLTPTGVGPSPSPTSIRPIASAAPSRVAVISSSTPEPLVPTRTLPPAQAEGSPSPTAHPAAAQEPQLPPTAPAEPTTPVSLPTITPLGPTAVAVPLPSGRQRFGVGVALGSMTDYPVGQLGIGWYLDWWVQEDPARPGGAVFWQMVHVSESGYRPDAETIRAAAVANPGSHWLVGNEPDVRWQDNTTPERYAELYYELYHLLKRVDPTCQVVIGGVSQTSPLRLAYLERILSTYETRYGEPMPVDVWNVHAFVLREERDSWGVDIPPGMETDNGILYEVDDHDDLAIVHDQILTFRRWMAEHGERQKPLVVSEYGILMPEEYGFGPERVQAFMEGSFDLFLTATDPDVGYARDENRLVQWWCWYSLAAPEDYYPTGNLADPTTGELTPLGAAFAAYSGP